MPPISFCVVIAIFAIKASFPIANPARTSPYRFYQYWLNTDDRDVISYLKYFTWLEQSEIEEYEQAVLSEPEKWLYDILAEVTE